MNSLIIAGNILKRAFRSKKELLILTLLPIIIIGIMTFIMNKDDIEITNAGYVNRDSGELGNELILHLQNQKGINLISLNEKDMKAALKNKKVSFIMLIPEHFSQQIINNEKAQVSFYPGEYNIHYEGFKQNVNQYIEGLYVIEKLADISLAEAFTQRLSNEGIKIVNSIIGKEPEQDKYGILLTSMGFIITFIMMLMFVSVGNILEDKKRLTLARILSSPIREYEFVTGNLIGSLSLGIIQIIPILLTLKFIFNIPWGINLLGMFLILLAFLFTTIGLGIGLAGIIKNKFNPLLLMSTVIVPTSILGGTFIPASMMPDFVNKIGYIVPQKWVVQAFEKMLQGQELHTILFEIGVIIMFGIAFATFGSKTLKPLSD